MKDVGVMRMTGSCRKRLVLRLLHPFADSRGQEWAFTEAIAGCSRLWLGDARFGTLRDRQVFPRSSADI